MTSDPRVPSETLYVVSAYEDGADYRLCRNFAEIRAAYIELCCGSDDPWHQDEINAAMAAIADEDNWNVDSVSVGVGDCGQFQVTKYPAHLFRAHLAQAEPVAWRTWMQFKQEGEWAFSPVAIAGYESLYAAPPCAVAEHDRPAQAEPIVCNLPFERIPQHAADPGFGPVPPRPTVVELRQIPQQPCAEPDRLAQWQPIETAPKDGTHIILSWGGKVFQGFYLDNSKSLAPWRGFRPMSGEVTPPGTPDYWTSLPAAPGSEGRNG